MNVAAAVSRSCASGPWDHWNRCRTGHSGLVEGMRRSCDRYIIGSAIDRIGSAIDRRNQMLHHGSAKSNSPKVWMNDPAFNGSGVGARQFAPQMLPYTSVRISRRQMNPDTPTTLHYPRSHLQQAQPQRADLCRRPLRAVRRFLQRLHQHASGRVQQKPTLVRHKPMTTRPTAVQVQLQFLDPVLAVPAGAVEGVDLLLGPPKIGDHIARIEFMLGHFDLDDHPACVRPGTRLVTKLVKQPILFQYLRQNV